MLIGYYTYIGHTELCHCKAFLSAFVLYRFLFQIMPKNCRIAALMYLGANVFVLTDVIRVHLRMRAKSTSNSQDSFKDLKKKEKKYYLTGYFVVLLLEQQCFILKSIKLCYPTIQTHRSSIAMARENGQWQPLLR